MSHKNDPTGVAESGDERPNRGLVRALVDRLGRHRREWAGRYRQMRFDAGR